MAKPAARAARTFTVAPRGLRAKLVWAFVFMSGVPLTLLMLLAAWFACPTVRQYYHLDRWFPMLGDPGAVWWVIGLIALSTVVALLGGLYLAAGVINPMIKLSHDAAQLARGECDFTLPTGADHDELSELTVSLNQLTGRVREGLTELKRFGDRATSLHVAINRRVTALSALLQIGEVVTGGADLDAVLDMVVENVASADEHGFSFLCLQPIEDLPLTARRAHQIEPQRLSTLAFDSAQALIDAQHPPAGPSMQAMWHDLGRPNLILKPVMVRSRLVGILGVGNYVADGQWTEELVEIVSLFVKQAAMAIENELLVKKAKALAIRDELTGLYTEPYMRQRLDEEIHRAMRYQRPCSCALFSIQGLEEIRRRFGDPHAERTIKQIARAVQESVTEVERVGRFNGHQILVLLPERNKRQAVEVVEAIKRRVAELVAGDANAQSCCSIEVSVSENPLDGATADALIQKALARGNGAIKDAPNQARHSP